MPAYVMAHVEVHDAQGYQRYIEGVPATVAAHGGRFVARCPDPVLLEGDAKPNRAVILEFPSKEQALAWYHSPAYQEILPLRQRHARATLLLLDEGALPGGAR